MKCPYCGIQIELIKINCGILRCGIYRTNRGTIRQIPKHASEKQIIKLRKNNQIIFGCGNPIQYKNDKLVKCEWI